MRVNGRDREVLVEPQVSLLQVLRSELGLVGTKEGCGTGYCGACTVLVDAQPVNACLFFAVDADHREVTTVEGLATGDQLHPIQSAFIAQSGLQCGFCTPGMLLSASALLQRNHAPNEEEIRVALAGNLCRCTGYRSIVEAVKTAAESLGCQSAGTHAATTRAMRSRA